MGDVRLWRNGFVFLTDLFVRPYSAPVCAGAGTWHSIEPNSGSATGGRSGDGERGGVHDDFVEFSLGEGAVRMSKVRSLLCGMNDFVACLVPSPYLPRRRARVRGEAQPCSRGGSLEPLSQLSQLGQLERAGPKERGLSQRGPPKWRLHGLLS